MVHYTRQGNGVNNKKLLFYRLRFFHSKPQLVKPFQSSSLLVHELIELDAPILQRLVSLGAEECALLLLAGILEPAFKIPLESARLNNPPGLPVLQFSISLNGVWVRRLVQVFRGQSHLFSGNCYRHQHAPTVA